MSTLNRALEIAASAPPARLPFWSDDFDMDLLKVLPEVEWWCASATRPLYVHGHVTHGRLNHPCVWNGDRGMLAFFSLHHDCPARPTHFYTTSPIVECTLLEALRDLWVHGCYATLDGRPFWDSGQTDREHFMPLMYHRRGWSTISEEAVTDHLAAVRRSIRSAIRRYWKAWTLITVTALRHEAEAAGAAQAEARE